MPVSLLTGTMKTRMSQKPKNIPGKCNLSSFYIEIYFSSLNNVPSLLFSILFLDSLKMHSKNMYAKHIRKWLNFEWKRLGKGKVGGNIKPFANDSMPSISPKSKSFIFLLISRPFAFLQLISIVIFPLSYLPYQFHTRQMDVIVVCLYADMLTIYS